MEIMVEARPEHREGAAAAGERLATLVKERIGVTARCTVTKSGTIERSLGKAKRVIDRRPKE